MITTLAVLKWTHILAMVYWLGGEWGVFQTSYNVVNHQLPMDERKRHMETAYRIDILARTGIVLLVPIGMHMGWSYGIQPWGGWFLVAMWLFFATWLSITWAAFFWRETDRGIAVTKFDEQIRFLFIPVIIIVAVSSLFGYGPFEALPGQRWFSYKMLIFAGLLIIGLKLRFIMREWTELFRVLAVNPGDRDTELTLERSIRVGRTLAYVYWIGIGTVAFLGAVKPI
jgi:hypothetical protein